MSATDTNNPISEPQTPVASRSRVEPVAVIILFIILALAGWFRFTGIVWDSNSHLHPDERFLTDLAANLSGVENPLDYLRTSVSTLNPYNVGRDFYVYGNFPMTVTRYAAEWATRACEAVAERSGEAWCDYRYTAYDGIHIVGRFLSALLDVVTVAFTFLIGRRLYGEWAGLIAAFLMATSVMAIQQSHFFTTDNWATVFTTIAIYAAVRAATIGDAEPRWRLGWYAVFGLALGLAAASRINMVPLALVINVSAVIWLARRRTSDELRVTSDESGVADGSLNSSLDTRHLKLPPRDFERALVAVALAAAVFILTFRVAQPYAFTDAEMVRQAALAETGQLPNAFVVAVKSVIGLNPQFLANMGSIQQQQSLETLFPPAVQWVNRKPILFPFTNMVLYGMGMTAGFFAWFAAVWATWRMFTSNYEFRFSSGEAQTAEDGSKLFTRPLDGGHVSSIFTQEWMLHAILVFWTLLYFLFMGTRPVASVRYFLPIYPTLFILAGWAIVYLWQRAKASDELRTTKLELRAASITRRVLVGLLAAVILVPSLLWAVTFTRIYRQPMTRIAASEWIFENVPSGATLLYDTADGRTRELQLPLREMHLQLLGAPAVLDFALPEDGFIRAVRFNYLSDPDFDIGITLEDAETIHLRLNEGQTVERELALDGEPQAIIIELPVTPLPAGQPAQLTIGAGEGGSIRAGTSVLINEHWDDVLPVSTGGRNPYGRYFSGGSSDPRPVTHPDNPEKLEEIVKWLDESDFIFLTSQRAVWTLPRMPLTYPMMIEYYESLFNGELGFDLVAEFHEDTRLGPLYISDTTGQIGWGERPNIGWPPPGDLAAEEAFSVYDHPPVWIFRKSDRYSSEKTRALLESVDLSQVVVQNPLEATQARNGLMLSEVERAAQEAGGTFREVFNIDGTLSERPWLAAVTWVFVMALLGWAAFPLTYIALGGLPDRGYALSRVLGLLVVSYLPWLAASTGLLPFTRWTIVLALFALVAVSALIFARRQREMTGFIRARFNYIVLVELLALALFLIMAGIRLGNPDVWDVIWGGEKPMDLSYFTAVMRSTTFPPYDPWFSGGYINYYYYGFVFVGALTKLLGVMPAMAYNLALPMLFSMTGLGVFGLAWNLVTAASERAAQSEPGTIERRSGWKGTLTSPAAVAGFIAVGLALLLGNLAQVRTISNAWYLAGSESLESIPLLGRAARTLDGGLEIMSGTPAPIYPGDWFWTATRAIGANPGEVQPITEFPFFTFLYGDLHAHMIAMPLQMLALGWAMGVVLAGEWRNRGAGEQGSVSRISFLVSLLIGALAIGVLRPTNTWDWPTYLLLGSLAVAYYFLRSEGFTWRAAGKAGLIIAALFGLSSLAFLPFTAHYGSAYSSVSLWPGSYTSLGDYFFVHGLFLFFVATHLIVEYRDWARELPPSWVAALRRAEITGWPVVAAAGLFLALLVLAMVRGYWVALVALPLLTAAGLLVFRPGLPAARRIAAALMSAAVGLTLVVEIIVLDGDVGRMNTVFKFYLQVWLMLSVACGAAAVWAWARIRGSERPRVVWQAVLGVLVFAALLYPLLATAAKWNIRMNKEAPKTLDGAAFLDYVEYGDTDYTGGGVTIRPGDDVAAIEWLQRNVEGSPVVMEAFGSNPYRSIAARVSMYTGLPAVVGWDWHQRQQRATTPDSLVGARINDVNTFYNTLDAAEARNILEKYGVGYVFLGTLENAYYWPQGLAKFDRMIAEGVLTEVFNDGAVRILQVVK